MVTASRDTVFQSHEWLRAYEAGQSSPEAYHILVYEDSELVAACPTYVERRDAWLREFGDIPPVLLSHSFQAWYSNILGRPDDRRIATVVLDTMEEIAADAGVEAFGFGAIPQRETTLREMLETAGYSVIQHNCSMLLDVPDSMEAYMAGLGGDHRRDFRRRIKRDREQGVAAEFVDDLSFERFKSLCYEVFDRHDDTEKRFSPSFLRAIRTHLSDCLRYGVVRSPDNKIMSAFLQLESDDCIYPWIAGIDYDYMTDHEPSLFYYYRIVQYAIEHGFSEIDIGRGLIDFKKKFGYEPWLTYLALKSSTTDLRLAEVFPDAEIHGGREVRSCC